MSEQKHIFLKHLSDSLNDAFYEVDQLRLVVYYALGFRLESIVNLPNKMPVIIMELVQWAERTDQIDKLIKGAREQNRTNQSLKLIEQEYAEYFKSQRAPEAEIPVEKVGEADQASTSQGTPVRGRSTGVRTAVLPVWFLERGAEIQRAVARVVLVEEVSGTPAGSGWATGFMVAPDLFMTCNHVIPSPEFANKLAVQFNYRLQMDGLVQETEIFRLSPDDFYVTNRDFDYSLLKVRPNEINEENGEPVLAGDRWGYIPLNDSPIFQEDQHLNIVHHPAGRPKEITVQENFLDSLYTNVVRYTSWTEPGSAGAPVLDNLWQLLALHHAKGGQDENGVWLKEGIRIDVIINDLREQLRATDQEVVLARLGID
jgi:V8-like Glu-specific endopeptidase